jgi:Inorganic pyrophosphatase
MHNFVDLQPYGGSFEMRMIVEMPCGSNIKLEYEPKFRAFTVSRALPLGLVYPYDWGFIPAQRWRMAIQLMRWQFMTEAPTEAGSCLAGLLARSSPGGR